MPFLEAALLRFPDSLVIGTRIVPESIRVDRFDQRFLLFSVARDAPVAHGTVTAVTFDFSLGKKIDIPLFLLEAYHAAVDPS